MIKKYKFVYVFLPFFYLQHGFYELENAVRKDA